MKTGSRQQPATLSRMYLLVIFWVYAMCSLADVAGAPLDPALLHWSRVLETYVNEQGQVDFQGLTNNPAELQAYVDYIATISPESDPAAFPGTASRIAYFINSYNALSMYNVLDSGIPETLGGWRKIPFFVLKRFTIGGDKMSLYSYENNVIRAQGEERVHFALNCMVAGCPRLPRTPFTGADLDAQLEREARHFFSEARNFHIDPEHKVVYLSWIMKHYREDFLARAPSLVDYVNKYVEDRIPSDYTVKYLPYDWTVNIQHRE